jgi:hypothetical protein
MSTIAGITEDKLLNDKKIRHVSFDGEWYFSIHDLNLEYIGAFKNVTGLILPVRGKNDKRDPLMCIAFSEIENIAKILENRPEFNQAIDVLFGFGKKK